MIRDLRQALRALSANKGFTCAAIATLAFGIGVNTAAFSMVNAMLVKRLPVARPTELAMFYWLRLPEPTVASYSGYGRQGPNGAGIRTSFSYLTFERLRDQSSSLADVFAWSSLRDLSVGAGGQTETSSADLVSGSYFNTLGLQAVRGRVLNKDDDRVGADPVAVIGHRYWQRRFQGDPSVIGSVIEVNQVPFVVVGVTAPEFESLRMGESTNITIPISLLSRLEGKARPVSQWWVQIMARLKPGVPREQALADVDRLFVESMQESWAARPPKTISKGTSIPQLRIMDGSRGPEGPRLDAMPILTGVLGIAGIVLLIGCVNVANLVLTRAWTRQQDIAIRFALGASRWRVVRQLLTESVVLACAGGLGGILIAFWGRDFLQWLPGADVPIISPAIDFRVVLFAGGISLLTAIVFGLGPSLRATRTSLSASINAARWQRRGWLRRSLVALQVALSLAMLVVAGQFLHTLQNLSRVDVGFDTANLLVFRVNPVARDGGPARAFGVLDELTTAIESVPGVRSTTMSAMPLLARAEWQVMVGADPVTPGAQGQAAYLQVIGPRFTETLGIPLLAGRNFAISDRDGAPRVAVINETMAKQLFGDPRPVGRQFQFLEGPDKDARVEVVGVVRDTAYARLQEANPPTFYVPHRQMAPSTMTFEVRTAVDPMSLVPAVQEAVHRVDPGLSLAGIKSQAQQIRETVALPSTFALVTSGFGIAALTLACIGLYGLVSFDVSRRTREIGLRMALGARRSEVVRLVLGEMMVIVTIGAGLGWALGFAASFGARGAFFGVQPGNPVAIAAATLVLAIASGLAGYLPARRASTVDPTQALRHE